MPTAQKSKNQHIYEFIHNAITSGELAAGQQVPTEAALGERFGASRQTVAQAMRRLEYQGLVVRRRGAGTFVKRLQPREGTIWRLLVPHASNGILLPIAAAISRVAQAHGYSLLFEDPPASVHRDEEMIQFMRDLCREYTQRKAAGVFFTPLILRPDHMSVNVEIAEMIDDAGIPLVLLDRDLFDYPRRSRFDLVGSANRRASATITQHLLELGYTRIDYISLTESVSTASARVAGFEDAFRDCGIEFDPASIHHIEAADASAVREIVRERRPEAIVCVNDHMAAHVMRHLAGMGIRIPDDLALVGFDDVDYAMLILVPLTTMRQPCARIGEMAARLMLERIADPSLPAREVSVECELVIRESCGALKRSVKAK